jgi:hypothetical protein
LTWSRAASQALKSLVVPQAPTETSRSRTLPPDIRLEINCG